MEAADMIVVAIYFILVLGIGFLAMWKANRNTVSGYFQFDELGSCGSFSICQ